MKASASFPLKHMVGTCYGSCADTAVADSFLLSAEWHSSSTVQSSTETGCQAAFCDWFTMCRPETLQHRQREPVLDVQVRRRVCDTDGAASR